MSGLSRKEIACAVLTLACCIGVGNAAPNPATDATRKANQAIADYLPFSNTQDFDDARHGFIADLPNPVVKGSAGNTVIDLSQYDFLKQSGPAPASVNPSLWRQSQLLAIRGLFKVVDGIYQVRNIDLANMTFIRGKTGWVVIDPLTSTETAKAALDLINSKVENLPVSAVIFTHSHVDHFAGIRAIVDEKDARAGKVIQPAQFTLHLQRQLAGGRDDQGQGIAGGPEGRRAFQQSLGHCQAKGDGLARPGLGGDQQIAALGLGFDHRALHWSRRGVVTLGQGAGKGGMGSRKTQRELEGGIFGPSLALCGQNDR